MLRRPLFLLSSTMALFGVAAAIHGIDTGYAKPLGIGLVMLCGAAVFALLYVGSRDNAAIREHSES
jgi:hypothetical protein